MSARSPNSTPGRTRYPSLSRSGDAGVALAHAVGQERERGERREAVPELGAVVLGAAVERFGVVDARGVVVVVPVRRLAAAHVEVELAAEAHDHAGVGAGLGVADARIDLVARAGRWC